MLASPLRESTRGNGNWGTFPLPSVVKQRAGKPVFQAMLTDHTRFLNHYTRIPKTLTGRIMPSLHLAKLELIANGAVLPSGQESPQAV